MGSMKLIHNVVLTAHLWPLSQKHLHFNRKQAEDFALYLRTECLQELLRQQAGGGGGGYKEETPNSLTR